jgi:hypothetical protein
MTFVLNTVTGFHIIICGSEAIVGMFAMPRINLRNVSNPIQNQQTVNCHIFGAPGTILTCHTNLTCAIYPEEVRICLQDDTTKPFHLRSQQITAET